MSGDIISFPGRNRGLPGQSEGEKTEAQASAKQDVSDLIRDVLAAAPIDSARLELVLDPEIGITLVDGEDVRPVLDDLVAAILPLLDADQAFRVRASSVYQPELPGSHYLGLAEGHYALVLFDGALPNEASANEASANKADGSRGAFTELRARVAAIHGHLDSSRQSLADLSIALYLPLRAEPAADRQAASNEGAGSVAVKPAHVLLVDDNEQVQSSVSAMLKVLGYRVTMRSGGADALDTLRRNPADFQVVLSDLTMPRVSGIELVARLKAIRPDLPVVLMTGFSIENAAAQTPGIAELLQKPFSLAELRRVIASALSI